MEENYQHWQLHKDNDQILWLALDRCDASANSINETVLDELDVILDTLNGVKGIVIRSAKASGILGADVHSFSDMQDVNTAMQFIAKGQSVLTKLENLSIPSIAIIHQNCLGGGLELALACRYRIATDDEKTKLALPEIKLGFHPGWGGTVRLPKLVGAMNAMDLILTGRLVRASQAKKMGIVDALVPLRHADTAASYYLQECPSVQRPSFVQGLTNHALLRPIICWKAKRDLQAKRVLPQHYPAFFAVLETFEKYGPHHQNAMQNEAESVRKVLEHPTALNLIRLFELQDKLKAFGKKSEFKAQHVHVIGAGTMGGDIAAWCALKGLTVTLQDREYQYIAPAMQRAAKLFKKKLKKPRLIQAAMDKLIPDVQGLGVKQADVIIEAIFENLPAKQALFTSLEENAKSSCILATNTSTFPLNRISEVMKDPSRLIGIHFFNPVAQMNLVEVIEDDVSQDNIVADALSFVAQIGKLPLPVKSSPGFVVNRLLMPYLMESVVLVEEGIPIEVVDKAAIQFGMPMGPIELADTVGLDICVNGADSFKEYFNVVVPDSIRKKVEQGKLGRKTGEGFYRYKNGKPIRQKAESSTSNDDIADRLILRIVNEAVACLREGVISDPDLVDAAMVFGTGFAPFRGGPMNYLQSTGAVSMKQQLDNFEKRYGERFNPDTGWENLVHIGQ